MFTLPRHLADVDHLVEQTNRYANQRNSNHYTPVSAEDITAYLGILIVMGLNPLPDMELFWSNDPFYNNSEISRIMPVFQQETVNSSTQSIDECTVKFKGRSSLKQYMPKKPIKRGFKVWARCDSNTGYLYQFEVYTGKGANMEDEGLGYNVVSKHSADLPEDTLLAFDNFFTSCNLLDDLFTKVPKTPSEAKLNNVTDAQNLYIRYWNRIEPHTYK
ncbi:hypothetical protein K1T71_014926 [Dendrolimus kikuchii]|nr:hypothetical protein K1T71_014926 [Dendrolimus kikuchii]